MNFNCSIQGLPAIHFKCGIQSDPGVILHLVLAALFLILLKYLVNLFLNRIVCSDPLLPSDEELLALAVKHDQQRSMARHNQRHGFPFVRQGQPVAWIKYGDRALFDEATAQKYIYGRLKQQPDLWSRVRVPKVYRTIEGNNNINYLNCEDGTRRGIYEPSCVIVMEYIRSRTVSQWLEKSDEKKDFLWGQVLYAMKALPSLEPPEPIPPPGIIDGEGLIMHPVFEEWCKEREYAPRRCNSVEDLQDLVNDLVRKIHISYLEKDEYANFVDEDFRICYCDPEEAHFMLMDDEGLGPIYIVDFELCMWLPVSWLACVLKPGLSLPYTLFRRDPIAHYLWRNLDQLRASPYSEINYRVFGELRYRYAFKKWRRT